MTAETPDQSLSGEISSKPNPKEDDTAQGALLSRLFYWIDRRLYITGLVTTYPVPHYATRLYYCLGGLALFSFIVQGVTGVILALFYHPGTEMVNGVPLAYLSVEYIINDVMFGAAIRNLHRWTANAMIMAVFLHMVRVYITGSYRAPRELNWIIGVALLGLTFAFGFTGYLLPWDYDAQLAAAIGIKLMSYVPFVGPFLVDFLAGYSLEGVGTEGLIRFYVVHVALLPIAIAIVMFFHFYLVKKHGISKPL